MVRLLRFLVYNYRAILAVGKITLTAVQRCGITSTRSTQRHRSWIDIQNGKCILNRRTSGYGWGSGGVVCCRIGVIQIRRGR